MGRFSVVVVVGYVPLILTGVLNMAFCKMHFLNSWKVPIDKGKVLKDGKRLFGDHKTIKGFIGYIVIACILNIIWGVLGSVLPVLEQNNIFYIQNQNTVLYNAIIGALMGFLYALFELPNSYIKRRLGIDSGSSLHAKKSLKYIFAFVDQADSLFGSMLILFFVYPTNIWMYLIAVAGGAGIHILLNMILYVCKLRKTII